MFVPRLPSSTRFVPFVLLVLGACEPSSSTKIDLPTVSRVEVWPDAHVAVVGDTLRFRAQAYDSHGDPVHGRAVEWNSESQSVATIDGEGRVVAVGPGVSLITATVDAVQGMGTVAVEPAACEEVVSVQLAPGEHRGVEAGICVVLPAGSAEAVYRVVAARPTYEVAPDDVRTATLTTRLRSITAVARQRPIRVQRRPPPDQGTPVMAPAENLAPAVHRRAATEEFHGRLRLQEQEHWTRLAVRSVGGELDAPRFRSNLAPAAPLLRVDPTPRPDCVADSSAVRTGVLVGSDDHLAVYQDSAQHAQSPVAAAAVARLIEYHAAYVREMIEAYWGRPSDLDGNGRVVVFVTPAVPTTVSAFVSAADLADKDLCEASNEMEVVYFNADLLRDMEHPTESSWDALGTLAHEVKHIVSLRHRLVRSVRTQSNAFHPLWMEEGTAEIAAQKSSRLAWAASGGPPVGARLTGEDVVDAFTEAGRVTPEMWGVVVRLLGTRDHFMSQPNGITGQVDGAAPGHSAYTGGWAFHNWLADAYGAAETPLADSTLFRALSDSTAPTGVAAITAATDRPFAELFEEFALAVGMAGQEVPPPTRGFTTIDFPSATAVVPPHDPPDPEDGRYPWPVTGVYGSAVESWSTSVWSGPIGTGGLRFHDFVSTGEQELEVRLEPTFPGRMIVIRIR